MVFSPKRLVLKNEILVTENGSVTVGLTKAGAPSDADFAQDPPIGILVLDTTNSRLYIKTAEDTWKYASLT
jgi:hypothetical protein